MYCLGYFHGVNPCQFSMHIAYLSSLILIYALFGYGYVLFEFNELHGDGYYSDIPLIIVDSGNTAMRKLNEGVPILIRTGTASEADNVIVLN